MPQLCVKSQVPSSHGLECPFGGEQKAQQGPGEQCAHKNENRHGKDRIYRKIIEEIPLRLAADTAYQNARENSDKQNARIEHDVALRRVVVSMMKDDTELFKQFMDNESFRRWMTDTVFDLTYNPRA